MKATDANRPLRVFDKAIQGGLGAGNLGLVMSRHGTGKVAVLTSIAVDHAMDARNTLHVSVGKSVSDIRAYDDEVLHKILESLGLQNRKDLLTRVERHKQIYTYRDGSFTPARLAETIRFLTEHAEFAPEMIEIQGWPSFREVTREELEQLKAIAQEQNTEIWLRANTHRDDPTDADGVPTNISELRELFSVMIALEPRGEHVHLRFVKTHDQPPPSGIHLEFDPASMLIRWR